MEKSLPFHFIIKDRSDYRHSTFARYGNYA